MQIYEELKARKLIAQVTDEEEIRELVNNGKAVFYIGFDPTAQRTLPPLCRLNPRWRPHCSTRTAH